MRTRQQGMAGLGLSIKLCGPALGARVESSQVPAPKPLPPCESTRIPCSWEMLTIRINQNHTALPIIAAWHAKGVLEPPPPPGPGGNPLAAGDLRVLEGRLSEGGHQNPMALGPAALYQLMCELGHVSSR